VSFCAICPYDVGLWHARLGDPCATPLFWVVTHTVLAIFAVPAAGKVSPDFPDAYRRDVRAATASVPAVVPLDEDPDWESAAGDWGAIAGEYCLTNADRRRVLLSMNPRELNHLARQRCDAHAQREIRELSEKRVTLARCVAPLATLTTCPTDGFEGLYRRVYGQAQPKP
jgi:hypothetical protein